MSDAKQTKKTYCSHCQKDVDLTETEAAPRSGQAMLQESDEVVCLDFGDHCDGEVCPLSKFRPVVMGVRLARSGMKDDWKTVRAQCEGCEQVSDLNVIDKEHAFCTLCGTTNTWMVLEFEDDGRVVVAKRKDG